MNPLILAVETATLRGSLCLAQGEHVLAKGSGDPNRSHSNTLLADIDRLFANVSMSLNDVAVFAVASGPGSFTGLRIGIATVKALAETLGRLCAGIPTLEAIAHSAGQSDMTLSLLPAGRGEVFAQAFSVTASGKVTALDNPLHLSPLRMLERYSVHADVLLAGDGVQVHFERIRDWACEHGQPLNSSERGWRVATNVGVLAVDVAKLALEKTTNDQLEKPNALQAIYVRPSDAELKQPAASKSK